VVKVGLNLVLVDGVNDWEEPVQQDDLQATRTDSLVSMTIRTLSHRS
jgi:hypothetical protein